MPGIGIPAPGTVALGEQIGPCVEDCSHRTCELSREQATSPCLQCGEPIGYEVKFYVRLEGGGFLVHASCVDSPRLAIVRGCVYPAYLEIHDDGACMIGNYQVKNGEQVYLVLSANVTRPVQVTAKDLILGRLEGLPDRPRLVIGETPDMDELVVTIAPEKALLVPSDLP